jgi:cytochrome P450
VQQKLYIQLHESMSEDYSSWNYSKVKALSYINDIINETLRLKPPIIQGLPRETPSQGIHIGENYIPGHVIVSVPTLLVQRDSRWWKRPNEFVPERWNERREQWRTDDSPWIPFQIGKNTCLHRGRLTNASRYACMRRKESCVHE